MVNVNNILMLNQETSTNTEPPPKNTFSDTVTQWAIFDEYVKDLAQKEKANKDKAKPVCFNNNNNISINNSNNSNSN